MSFNKVILMGRITHDLELRTTPSGVSVCQFSIAVDRRFQAKGEERKTDFFRITAWRASADFVVRYFRKGSMILVEGELHNNNYTDKNGNTVYGMEIVADQISFTGEKANGGQGGQMGQMGQGGYQGADYGYQQGGYQGGQNSYANNNYAGGYQQNNYGGAQQSAPQQTGAPSAPSTPSAPADFGGASDDNYPF